MGGCLFCRISKKELPSEIIYEDNDVLAFNDINPQAPIHVLIIPKRHISFLSDLTPGDKEIMGHAMLVASKLACDLGINEGYRVVVNCGEGAGQTVSHIHLHLLGGRFFKWPPG
ncbi:MAG: histidine triad nucleotide-binding protein [Firmicutes bacterium]|nr:histidine triad nucleotide-binding protein [Bacillota bacterium]